MSKIDLIKKEVVSERKFTLSLPSTLNEENRSVRAVILTETPVLRYYDWEYVDEILVMSGGEIPESVPLLDSHDSFSTRSVLGSISDFVKRDNELEGELKISSVEDRVFTKVKEGHLRELSGGAMVRAYYYIKKGSSFDYNGKTYTAEERPIVLAVDWELTEGSLVARGADKNCTTRSQSIKGEDVMPKENNNPEKTPETPPKTTERKETSQEPVKVDTETIRKEAEKVERERIGEIYASCRSLKVSEEFAETLIADGVDISTARAKIMEEVKRNMKDEKTPDVKITRDNRDSLRTALGIASKRMLGVKISESESSDLAKTEFNSCRSVQAIARALLESNGVRTFAMTNEDVYTSLRAEIDGYAMEDFAAILQTAGKSVLVEAFEQQNPTLPLWTGEEDLTTFNQYSQAALSPIAGLDVVAELNTLPLLNLGENAETVKLLTNAGVVTLSRQAIISDSLGGFKSILMNLGEAAMRKAEKVGYAKLEAIDFSADSITPADLSLNTLEELNVLLMERKITVGTGETAKEEEIGAPGQYLLVPSKLSRTAHEITKSPVYGTDHAVNPYYGQITPIATPFLSNKKAFYLAGSRGKTLNRYYLNGNRTPILDTYEARGNEALGVQFRIIFDFAVGIVSKYYLAKNAGEAATTTTTTTAAPTTTTTTTTGA